MNQDLEHLRLLSIFHYIVAVITALLSSFPLIHVTIGLMMALSPESFSGDGVPPPAFIGWLFALFGGAFVLCGWALAIAMVFAGRYLKQHRKHTFCLVVAALSCIAIPFGTALGVFTIIVLIRPSVKQLFGLNSEVEPAMR